jgi:hypothetical protein
VSAERGMRRKGLRALPFASYTNARVVIRSAGHT